MWIITHTHTLPRFDLENWQCYISRGLFCTERFHMLISLFLDISYEIGWLLCSGKYSRRLILSYCPCLPRFKIWEQFPSRPWGRILPVFPTSSMSSSALGLFVNVCFQVGRVWLFFNLMLMFSSRLILISGCGCFQHLVALSDSPHSFPASVLMNDFESRIALAGNHPLLQWALGYWLEGWTTQCIKAARNRWNRGLLETSWSLLAVTMGGFFIFIYFFRWDKGENVERKLVSGRRPGWRVVSLVC